jgi:hypothetical protein
LKENKKTQATKVHKLLITHLTAQNKITRQKTLILSVQSIATPPQQQQQSNTTKQNVPKRDNNPNAPSQCISLISSNNPNINSNNTNPTTPNNSVVATRKVKIKSKPNNSANNRDNASAHNDDDNNIDNFLSELIDSNGHCAFVGCDTKVSIAGHNCQYCNKRYCIKHCNAIIHDPARKLGCADGNAIDSRTKLAAANHSNSNHINYNQSQHSAIKAKLAKKTAELELKRKAKKPEKKNK